MLKFKIDRTWPPTSQTLNLTCPSITVSTLNPTVGMVVICSFKRKRYRIDVLPALSKQPVSTYIATSQTRVTYRDRASGYDSASCQKSNRTCSPSFKLPQRKDCCFACALYKRCQLDKNQKPNSRVMLSREDRIPGSTISNNNRFARHTNKNHRMIHTERRW